MLFTPPLVPSELIAELGESFTDLVTLSSGGQGAVFRARTTGDNPVDVALKVYAPDHLEQRAHREVQALERLAVPSIARVIAHGTVALRSRNCFYLATEFIPGDLLTALIARGPQPPADACGVGISIAQAVDALWRERIVHRDVKPGNIIAQADRSVLIDLGIARHVALESITTTGATWGTPGYMSPEQMRALNQLSCKSDVFALGIVLQELLAGRHPTGGDQRALLNGGMPTLTVASSCPDSLARVVDRMLLRRPERRPSPTELIAQLGDAQRRE